jgi:hypothetical protein
MPTYAADGSYLVTVVGGSSGGGTANPNPGADYSTSGRQDTGLGVLGTQADAASAVGAAGSLMSYLRKMRDNLGNNVPISVPNVQAANGGSPGQSLSVQGGIGGVPLATTIRGAGTNRSATVGTTASTLMAANTARQGWKIKNDSAGDIWINFDTTATAVAGGGNIKIAAGGYLASEPGFIETGAISVIGSAASLNITAREH